MALRDDGDIVINLRMDDKDFAVTVKNSGRLLRSFREDLNKTASGVDGLRAHFGSFSTSFRHTIQMFATARFAVMDFYDVVLRLPTAILETTGEIERLTKLMEGLSKATTQTAKALEAQSNKNFVIDMAKKAPFEIKALADSLVKLRTGGIDPLDGSMQALVDSVARFGGDSQALHRASVAIQQMGGKGVISMEELRQQLGEAVPDAMRMMAEGMGLSMGELTKQVSLGAVESTDALRRMFTMMEFYNRGAALKMMDTWTGLSSRLKTEWTLLQTAIGDSGFADAVKDQIKDLIGVMGSGQGMSFAKKLGADLASLVRTLREVADVLRENWTLIKMVGEAMLVAFGVSKVAAMARGLGEILKQTTAIASANAKKFQAEASMRALNRADELKSQAQEMQAQAAQEAALLAKRQVYYKARLAQHAKHMAEIRALEIANDITAAKMSVGGNAADAALLLSRQRKIRALEDEVKQIDKVISKERQMQAAMQAGLIITNQSVDAANKNAAAAANAASKLGLLSRAAVGARVALAAIGGPIGLVTTALMFGIPAWLEWGNAGEKAIKKIRDALDSKTADKDTIKLIGEELDKKRQELADINSRKIDFSLFPNPTKAKDEVAAEKARLEKEIGELERDQRRAKAQSIENEVQAEIVIRKNGYQKQLDTTAEFYVNEQAAIIAAAEKKLEGLKKGSKEEIQIEKDKAAALRANVKQQGDALYKIVQEQHARAEAALKSANNGGSSTQIESAKAHLTAMSEELVKYEKFRNEATHLLDPIVTKVAKEKKPDPLTQALEQAKGDLEAAKIKMADIVDGAVTLGKLREAALAEIMGDRASGRFNVKDERGNSVAPSVNDPKVAEYADVKAQTEQINREKQAQTALTRLTALSAAERQTALERFSNGEYYERETTGVHKLQRQIAALQKTLVEGTPAFINFREESREIISNQAIADLVNFSADLKKASIDLEIALEDTDIGRKQKAFDLEMAALRSQINVRKQAIIDNTNLTNEEVARLTKRADEELKAHLEKANAKHLKDMRSPLQELAKQWDDVTKRMRDASVRWANDSMDAMMNFLITGKFEWRNFVTSILTDIMRISMQKTIGGVVSRGIDSGVNFLSSMLGGSSGTTSEDGMPIDPTTNAMRVIDVSDTRMAGAVGTKPIFEEAQAKLSSMWDGLKTGFQGVWDSMTSMLGGLGRDLSSIFSQLGNSLSSFLSSMSGGGTGSFLSSILGTIVQVGMGAATGGMGGAAMAGTSSVASYTGYGGMGSPTMRFAEGGIMSEFGPRALRRYANGGIANFPQFAEFGEGSRPEAYVPLPDGRTIPVTMTGGAAGSGVLINITINKNGEEKNSSSGEDAAAWTKMGQRIKTVVKEELAVQQRPGGLLYK